MTRPYQINNATQFGQDKEARLAMFPRSAGAPGYHMKYTFRFNKIYGSREEYIAVSVMVW